MDPISQACFGASLSQSATNDRRTQVSALIIGALAGMAPDLDVFINSPTDPLLFLEYHRQFTHSLFFIPFGALICSLLFYPFIKSKLSFSKVYLFSFLGYATHGLLDACTSYGTQLFWPFSSERIAWNIVSIIDPLFTLPIIILIIMAVIKSHSLYARIAFIYAILFLSLGLVQKQRAENALIELASQRNHQPERIIVKPSFANRQVWKMVYEYKNKYYVDAIKLLWDKKIITGTSIDKLDIKRDFPLLNLDSIKAKDIERFRLFSDDFLAVNPLQKNMIIDVRYSFIPNSIKMMWGIELNSEDEHVFFRTKSRPDKKTLDEFFDMVF